MSRNESPALIAGESLYPSRFAKLSTSADNTALAAGAGERTIGITGVGGKDGREDASNDYHAQAGDPVELFGLGDICLLQAGSGGWTRGDRLKPDALARGVTTTVTTEWVGAEALESAAALEYGRVQVVRYTNP